jgi:hypothetical protein
VDEWWTPIDNDMLGGLAGHGAMAPAELGLQLRLSEGATTSLLSMLAQEGEGSYLPGRMTAGTGRGTRQRFSPRGDAERARWKNDRL